MVKALIFPTDTFRHDWRDLQRDVDHVSTDGHNMGREVSSIVVLTEWMNSRSQCQPYMAPWHADLASDPRGYRYKGVLHRDCMTGG